MTARPSAKIERAVKIARLFDSECDGEALAAVRALRRLVQPDGQCIADLVERGMTRDPFGGSGWPHPTRSPMRPVAPLSEHQVQARAMLPIKMWNEREARFLGDIAQQRTLTEKQANWFAALLDRYKAERGWRA